MHVGKAHVDRLPQPETPPRAHADTLLPIRVELEPVVVEACQAHHALHGHRVELHEEAEIRHPGNDAGKDLPGALLKQEAAQTAANFPLGFGGGALAGVALVLSLIHI